MHLQKLYKKNDILCTITSPPVRFIHSLIYYQESNTCWRRSVMFHMCLDTISCERRWKATDTSTSSFFISTGSSGKTETRWRTSFFSSCRKAVFSSFSALARAFSTTGDAWPSVTRHTAAFHHNFSKIQPSTTVVYTSINQCKRDMNRRNSKRIQTRLISVPRADVSAWETSRLQVWSAWWRTLDAQTRLSAS